MERAELIRYLHVVLDLENAAQFCRETEKKLGADKKRAQSHLYALQEEPVINLPHIAKPIKPDEPLPLEPIWIFFSLEKLVISFFLGMGGVMTLIAFLMGGNVDSIPTLMVVGIGFLGMANVKYIFAAIKTQRYNKEQMNNYVQYSLPLYEENMKIYQTEISKLEKRFAIYDEARNTRKLIEKKVMDQIECFEVQQSKVVATLADIERKLQFLYEKNIIYSKYRNLIALSYIVDYIGSGIADGLTGPNGAYAQYENDARTQKICNSLDELKEIVESGFSNVLHAQSQIYQALVEIRGGVYQIQRSVDNVYSALGQAASTLGTLLKNEQEFSERTSQQLAQIRQAAEVTAKDTSMIAFNQYIDAKARGVDAYYALNM